jgi:hypothetical protein
MNIPKFEEQKFENSPLDGSDGRVAFYDLRPWIVIEFQNTHLYPHNLKNKNSRIRHQMAVMAEFLPIFYLTKDHGGYWYKVLVYPPLYRSRSRYPTGP